MSLFFLETNGLYFLRLHRVLVSAVFYFGLPVFLHFSMTARSATTMDSQSLSVGSVVFLGDSHTWLGGNDCTREEGWTSSFRSFFSNSSYRSYARSGATWTHTSRTSADVRDSSSILSDKNVIYNQILRLRNDVQAHRIPSPDLIIILAGTNDAWFGASRPNRFGVSPETAFFESDSVLLCYAPGSLTSLSLALRYDCLLLRHFFPQARLVLLTPFQSTAFPVRDLRVTASIIESCANRLGIDLIRLDTPTLISAARERRRRTFTVDGTHTNKSGARRIGEYVARRIGSLIQ